MANDMTIPRRMESQLRAQRRQRQESVRVNVSEAERWLSLVGGGLLALDGLRRGTLGGFLQVLAGGALVQRGLTGHCSVYRALALDTSDQPHGPRASVAAGAGIKVDQRITIYRPVRDVYNYWRSFENLPRIMSHLVAVEGNGGRSHWVARGPLGMAADWDAEIVNEKVDELIAWRSLPGADIDTAGSVHFRRVPGGTEVQVILKYNPPTGKVGAAVARLFGVAPEQQIAEDLQRFKQRFEAGVTMAASG